MSSNNTKKVNNNIEKISTISKNFDELHQIYKDIFNSGELGILESDKENIYYTYEVLPPHVLPESADRSRPVRLQMWWKYLHVPAPHPDALPPAPL